MSAPVLAVHLRCVLHTARTSAIRGWVGHKSMLGLRVGYDDLLSLQAPGGAQQRSGPGCKAASSAAGNAHLPAYPGFMQPAQQAASTPQQARDFSVSQRRILPCDLLSPSCAC